MKLSTVFKYRTAWMGFAAIWIVVFHSAFGMPGIVLNFIKACGYGGVDIFMLASGIGCSYSLNNNSNPALFLRRRINKVIPAWWAFLIVMWIPYSLTFSLVPLKTIIGLFTCVQPITGNGNVFSWYITGVWVTYLLAPLLKSVADRNRSFKSFLMFFLLIVLCSLPFLSSNDITASYIRLCAVRLPLFYIGIVVGNLEPDLIVSAKRSALIFAGMIFGFASLFLLYMFSKQYSVLKHYFFILIAPGICLLISTFFERLKKYRLIKIIKLLLEYVGQFSFEIFLVHFLIYEAIEYYPLDCISRRLYCVLGTLCIIPGVFILKRLEKPVLSLLIKLESAIDDRMERTK